MAVFLQVITLFLLIFCGFFSAKGKLVDENGISTLNKIVLYFALPALTLYGLQKDASPELIHDLILVFFIILAIMILSGLIAYFLYRSEPNERRSVLTNLVIHLAGEQMEKKASKVIEGENLDLLVGSIPAASDDEKEKKEMKDRVKANILNILSKEYGVDEEDFLSAEIEVVPAGAARDYGFDRSMIMGYGHDDRVCAYPSFAAMLEIEKPQHTSVCLLVDKEEIGSVGASGMQSHFFEDSVAEIINLLGEYSELKVRRALHNSRVLSSDVSAAFDPNYPSVMEKRNCAYFGKGLVLNKYTGARGKSGSNDANAEYIARLRRIFDDNDVSFQTSELGKVDQGGGGTIAYILANYGMNVIDSGVAVLNMHAPWEIISKVDLYEALHGYVAFLKEA